MKVLLIQPPIRDYYQTDIRLLPLGLGMLKAAVKKFRPDVQVLIRDYHQGQGRRTVAAPKELAHLKDYWIGPDRGPFSTFHHYYHFGAEYDRIAAETAREAPDLVGISSMFTPYFMEALETARAIKHKLNAPIVMGGAHVTADPAGVLADPAVDYVIVGEGERPLVELIGALADRRPLDSAPNLGYKTEKGMAFTSRQPNFPLAELPWADLDDLPPNRYLLDGRPLCFLLTSRGCPHGCAFCAVHQTFGRTYRTRPVLDVLEEVKARYDQGRRAMDFEDDNLTLDPGRFKSLLDGLIGLFPGREVRFTAMNGVSYDGLDDDILERMVRAGFTHLNLSLVSSSERTRGRMNRPHALARFSAVTSRASALGLKMVAYQILGLPGETLEEMIETMAFLARLPVVLGPSLFYMTPGSDLARGFPPPTRSDYILARGTAMAVETGQFQRDDLYTLFLSTRIINFLKRMEATGDLSLPEALIQARQAGPRMALGAEILERLRTEKRLFAALKNGWAPLERFRTGLFERLWSAIGRVRLPSGGWIHLA